MGLATLANLPTNREQLLQMSFANMDSHRKIADAIFRTMNGQVLPIYVFDPIPSDPNGLLNWGLLHQATHNQQNEILNIQGEDLSSLDFKNEEQLSAWVWQHFNEHYLAETKLGIT